MSLEGVLSMAEADRVPAIWQGRKAEVRPVVPASEWAEHSAQPSEAQEGEPSSLSRLGEWCKLLLGMLFIACLVVGFATWFGHGLGIDRLFLELGLGSATASIGAGLVGTVGLLTVIVICMNGGAGGLVGLFWLGIIAAFTPFPEMTAQWFSGFGRTWTLLLSGLSSMLLTFGCVAALFVLVGWTGMTLAGLGDIAYDLKRSSDLKADTQHQLTRGIVAIRAAVVLVWIVIACGVAYLV